MTGSPLRAVDVGILFVLVAFVAAVFFAIGCLVLALIVPPRRSVVRRSSVLTDVVPVRRVSSPVNRIGGFERWN